MTQPKIIKTHDYQYSKISTLIEQSELSDKCPCKSGKAFGACCGQDLECPCKSHRSAGECCFANQLERRA